MPKRFGLFMATSSLVCSACGAGFTGVQIQIGERAGDVEKNAASLLAERIGEQGVGSVRILGGSDVAHTNANQFVVLLGLPENHSQIRKLFDQLRIPPLARLSPGPEGFLVKAIPRGSGCIVLVAGLDPRGVLYGAGELLRQLVVRNSVLELPSDLSVRSAPAFEVRGTQFGQSSVALNRAKVRPWTEQDRRRAILDIALAGLNTVEVGEGIRAEDPVYRLLKSFDLKTLVHYGPNTGSGPPGWQAAESIGRGGYLCPSVPKAREALLVEEHGRVGDDCLRGLAHERIAAQKITETKH
jgi:hypothetical protein